MRSDVKVVTEFPSPKAGRELNPHYPMLTNDIRPELKLNGTDVYVNSGCVRHMKVTEIRSTRT
jgi:hypothetical protein